MIKQITLTGADEDVYIPDLLAISEKYPFVEWGILLFDRRMGEPRYPSYRWIESLIKRKTPSTRLSLHICSESNRVLALHGIENKESLYTAFDRIQFNCGNRSRIIRYINKLGSIPAISDYNIIVGGNYAGIKEVPDFISPMFDLSGGEGLVMDTFQEPYKNSKYTGYAGGINTSNIFELNSIIADMNKDTDYWLDMESSLRVNGIKFNIGKCIETLKLMEPFINNEA